MKTKRSNASRTQLIAIHKYLSENLICVNEADKLFEYKEGASDAILADEMNISPNSVKGARVELFGKIRYHTNPSTINERILTEELIDLHDRFNKLLITLSVNKVADVRHLQSVCKLKDKT